MSYEAQLDKNSTISTNRQFSFFIIVTNINLFKSTKIIQAKLFRICHNP